MHTRYVKRTRNKPVGNKPSQCQNVLFAMETQAIYTRNVEMTCLLCTHDTSKSIAFSRVTCFVFWVRKAMFRNMTKWHVCYAHTIHQTNEKQTTKKRTIEKPKCRVCKGNTSSFKSNEKHIYAHTIQQTKEKQTTGNK